MAQMHRGTIKSQKNEWVDLGYNIFPHAHIAAQHPPTVGDDVTQRPVGTETRSNLCMVFLDINPTHTKKSHCIFWWKGSLWKTWVKQGIITLWCPWSIKGPFQNTDLHPASSAVSITTMKGWKNVLYNLQDSILTINTCTHTHTRTRTHTHTHTTAAYVHLCIHQLPGNTHTHTHTHTHKGCWHTLLKSGKEHTHACTHKHTELGSNHYMTYLLKCCSTVEWAGK